MTSELVATEKPVGRLSVTYLLCLMAGIGIAITIAREVEQLRFSADRIYYRKDPAEIDGFGLIVASVYGLCLTTFLFAIRSGQVWKSPGKILALLFASMCVLNWGLDGFSGAVTSSRINFALPAGFDVSQRVSNSYGYIFGIWYRNFATSVGYVVVLPLLMFVLYKTRKQPVAWRVVWMGFLAFDLLVIADIYFGTSSLMPPYLRPWYFDLAIGLPLALLAVALLTSLFRKQYIDWWTAVVSLPLLLTWCVGVGWRMMTT